MDPRLRRKNIREMWTRTVLGLAAVVAVCLVVYVVLLATSNEREPPAVQVMDHIDAGLNDGCYLIAEDTTRPEAAAEVRARPSPLEMVTGEIPNGTRLEVGSVRASFVRVTAPREGWMERRYTRRVCE